MIIEIQTQELEFTRKILRRTAKRYRQLLDCDDGAEQAKRRALQLVAEFAQIRTEEREEAAQ